MHMSEVLCVQLKQMASQPAGAEEMGRVKNMLKVTLTHTTQHSTAQHSAPHHLSCTAPIVPIL